MPYLDRNFRMELLSEGGEDFLDYMQSLREDTDWAGAINYVNFVMLRDRAKRDYGNWKKYWRFAMWAGTMLCCILEAYRRIVAPYEDRAIARNGDVI